MLLILISLTRKYRSQLQRLNGALFQCLPQTGNETGSGLLTLSVPSTESCCQRCVGQYRGPHLRMCHSEFKRSSNNRVALKSVREELRGFDQTYNWKIFYPVLFCLTRWLGLQRCADILSRKDNRVILKRYAQTLRDKNFGPRDFDTFRHRRRRGRQAVQEVGGDDSTGDVGTDNEEEDAEV